MKVEPSALFKPNRRLVERMSKLARNGSGGLLVEGIEAVVQSGVVCFNL